MAAMFTPMPPAVRATGMGCRHYGAHRSQNSTGRQSAVITMQACLPHGHRGYRPASGARSQRSLTGWTAMPCTWLSQLRGPGIPATCCSRARLASTLAGCIPHMGPEVQAGKDPSLMPPSRVVERP